RHPRRTVAAGRPRFEARRRRSNVFRARSGPRAREDAPMLPRLASRLTTATLIAAALASSSACSRHHATDARPVLFTSDEEGGAAVAMDPAQATVLARIPVGKRPRGMKLSPDGARLYVALSGTALVGGRRQDSLARPPPDRSADGIAVVDVAKRAVVATLAG